MMNIPAPIGADMHMIPTKLINTCCLIVILVAEINSINCMTIGMMSKNKLAPAQICIHLKISTFCKSLSLLLSYSHLSKNKSQGAKNCYESRVTKKIISNHISTTLLTIKSDRLSLINSVATL